MPSERMSSTESQAWINGAPTSRNSAVSAAAALLGASRQALFAGLGTDIHGIRAAGLLAEQVGGVIDHMHSAAILRDLDSMRETGAMLTAPGEAHVRADVVLLVGEGPAETWPGLGWKVLRESTRPDGSVAARRVIWLAPSSDAELTRYDGELDRLVVGRGVDRTAALATLRARVKGRSVTPIANLPVTQIDAVAEALRGARFGVLVWNAAVFDAMELEMLNGLARDLNETTRFSTLPAPCSDNGLGVLSACGWTTGFPMRTGFGLGMPQHDPWRYDLHRLVVEGETDCIAWISSFGAAPPSSWPAPAVALCDAATRFAREPKVRIDVGRPGVDHDAVLHSSDTGSLVAIKATAANDTPSVAKILSLIAKRLAGEGASR